MADPASSDDRQNYLHIITLGLLLRLFMVASVAGRTLGHATHPSPTRPERRLRKQLYRHADRTVIAAGELLLHRMFLAEEYNLRPTRHCARPGNPLHWDYFHDVITLQVIVGRSHPLGQGEACVVVSDPMRGDVYLTCGTESSNLTRLFGEMMTVLLQYAGAEVQVVSRSFVCCESLKFCDGLSLLLTKIAD
ncbi:hypothetical protein Bbelb_147610 [Branchiostoma belcheri]|nr:hypothetical protein Bbelb_147610 [Branchiostoma belcheri]